VAQPPCIYNHFRARVLIRCYAFLLHAINENKCGSASLYIQSFPCTCANLDLQLDVDWFLATRGTVMVDRSELHSAKRSSMSPRR
jgi:hypothetical protein